MDDEQLRRLVQTRVHEPEAVAEAAARRRRPTSLLGDHGKLMIVAADHAARGALRAGDRPTAMGDRIDVLDRLCVALSRPGVNGVLGTPDVLEDLLLLGALDDKVAIGSMNRGGLAGAVFGLDDRFTSYDADGIASAGLEGGKVLARIDLDDPASVSTLEATAGAVSALAQRGLMAMLEPFMSHREGGHVTNDLTPAAMVQAIGIAAGLGTTSAYTWLKVPVVADMERVMRASTLPALILGGEVDGDPDVALAGWQSALALPTVQGLVIGRSLLYPPGDDVAATVDAVVGLL